MKLLRNREIQWLLVALGLAGALAGFMGNILFGWAGVLASGCVCFVFSVIFCVFTAWRYKKIEALSNYLGRISNGERNLQMDSNAEGELSILKNEIYKVGTALIQQAEYLGKDREALADGLSDISHQIKTPLTGIMLSLDLLNRADMQQEKRNEMIEGMQEQLQHMEWLVSALLKISRLDANMVTLKRESILIDALMEKAAKPLLIFMELKEIELKFLGDKEICLTCDSHWTAEAVSNIIKNCAEYSKIGGKICVTWSVNPIYTEIKISDNGNGIAKEDLPHIFKRFYKGRQESAGIGIGLAMSQSIIRQQAGDISVKSKVGQGTTFFIKFYYLGMPC